MYTTPQNYFRQKNLGATYTTTTYLINIHPFSIWRMNHNKPFFPFLIKVRPQHIECISPALMVRMAYTNSADSYGTQSY
ncbi:MAG: hypothetical protein HXN41_10920 [Prevotella histicola]|nr:hypothetical protein [Prevotella histicola]PTL31930.1 hypothetical protein AXF23_13245 [Prevotella sp. oral taxon 313]